MARLRSCKYCGRVHASDYDCGRKPKRIKESTDITKLRTCRKWARARAQANERDHYLCRVCFESGVITSDGLETHHIVPLVDNTDLAYDLDNLITLCVKHHKAADAGKVDRDRLRRIISKPMQL